MKNTILIMLLGVSLACNPEVASTQVELGVEQLEQKEPGIEEVIPPGYEIVESDEGPEVVYRDLNEDGQMDAAVLIVMKGDPAYDQAEEVLLMIYTADRHGQFQLASHSNNLGGESLMYTQSKRLSVKKNVISYFHQSMRHDFTLKFRYDNKLGDFTMIGKDYNEYGGMEDGPRHISINYSTGVKLIKESRWDDQTEEVVQQPERRESFSKPLQTLPELDWETIYDDL